MMSTISSKNPQIFKNIVGKLPEDIFKEVCTYLVPGQKDYIFQSYKLKSNLQKEAYILRSLIKNDLPLAEKDYDIKLKNALKQIIKNIVSKNKYLDDKKINEIISVYVRNIDILDLEKTNTKKFKIILTLNKIRNYKFIVHFIEHLLKLYY